MTESVFKSFNHSIKILYLFLTLLLFIWGKPYSDSKVDLDFEINSSKGYTHVDFKTPIDFQDLADNKGIDVSNFPSLETVAYNMGKKIPPQKEEFCGLPGGPKSPDNVLHVVNLDLIKDSNQKQNMIDRVLKEAEDKSGNTRDIYFLNYL